MNTQNFKSKIKEIRKEALQIGFSINTMNNYLSIWNKYINWKNLSNFDYNEEEYVKFLLELDLCQVFRHNFSRFSYFKTAAYLNLFQFPFDKQKYFY